MSTRAIREQRGQAAAELALVLPLLAMLLFAIIQLGVVFNQWLSLTDAARAGSRVAAVSRLEGDPVGKAVAAVEAAAPDLAEGDLQVSVSPSPPWTTGQSVTVAASYPYEITIPFVGPVVDRRLTTTITERVE